MSHPNIVLLTYQDLYSLLGHDLKREKKIWVDINSSGGPLNVDNITKKFQSILMIKKDDLLPEKNSRLSGIVNDSAKAIQKRILEEQTQSTMTSEKRKEYNEIVASIEVNLGKKLEKYSLEDDDFEDYIE
ncbi:hypothetical protein HDU92_006967 [Lobulomyces angularis]|nr:hypothetical protein HDU92_006967 [Lobulomyces angularis]